MTTAHRREPMLQVVGVARRPNANVEDLLRHSSFRFLAAGLVQGSGLGEALEGAERLGDPHRCPSPTRSVIEL